MSNVMQNLADRIRKEAKDTIVVAPEKVDRTREIDITSILNSGLVSDKALENDGIIDRVIR